MNKRNPNKEKQIKRFIMTDLMKSKIEPRDEIEFWTRLVYKGIETNYLISTLGRIKRKKKYSKKDPEYVTQYINRDGYLQVQLRINKKYYLPTVHRLVAISFIPIPEEYISNGYSCDDLMVNHINGVTYDPYVCNLEWCTPSENTIHALKNNLRIPNCGEDHPNSKLSEGIVRSICEKLQNGNKNIDISKDTGVPVTLVNQIKNKNIWKHISSEYDIPRKPRDKYNYLSETEAHEICKYIVDGFDNETISKLMKVDKYIVANIKNHRRWVKVSSLYDF